MLAESFATDLSKPLRANASLAEAKRAQERVSGWLSRYDFVKATGGWLLKNIPRDLPARCQFPDSIPVGTHGRFLHRPAAWK